VSDTNEQPQAAQVVVKRRLTPSLVWIIPIVAALIAGWLAIKTVNDRGPIITIRFDSAAGLEAGKTKIRYRDVDIGVVETVRLDEDLTHVLVTARMDKRATPFLTESARFWIVRARVTSGEVSGLATLFSGVHIATAPGKEGRGSNRFIGLESPPVLTGDLPGRHFTLKTQKLGSLDIGAPVYYHQIQVGRVVSYALNEQSDDIDLQIFVEAPHHLRVSPQTRFWNAAGVDISLDAEGLKVDTESLITILSGGIAFTTPDLAGANEPAAANTEFTLYPDRRSSLQKSYQLKQRFLLYFSESVRGLAPGAPVEFRGIRIGQVIAVDLEFDMEQMQFRIPVVVEIEPERVNITGSGAIDAVALAPKLVERGLRAQLKVVNLLTGQLAVSLNIYPNEAKVALIYGGAYPEMPTLPTPLEEIAGTVTSLLKKIDQIPFDKIAGGLDRDLATFDTTLKTADATLKTLDATLRDMQSLAKNLDAEVAPAATATIEELRRTLAALQNNFGADSSLSFEAGQALDEFTKAARSLRALTDYLERHPESLLRGKN
jgi:paraquat-inducible protein B